MSAQGTGRSELRSKIEETKRQLRELESQLGDDAGIAADESVVIPAEKYHHLFHNTPIGCITLQPETRKISDCNKKAAALIQQDLELLPGRRFDEFLPDDQRLEFSALLSKLPVHEEQEFNTSLQSLVSQPVPVKLVVKLISANGSGGDTVFVTILDQSEQTSQHQELKSTQVKNALITEMMMNIFYSNKVSDNNKLELEYMTGAVEEIAGYSLQEIQDMPQKWRSIILSEDAAALTIDMLTESDDKTVEIEYRIKRKDGTVIWVSDRAMKVYNDETGQLERVIGTIVNATDERKKNYSLKKFENKIEFHIQNSPLAYLELNRELEIIEWNPAAEEMFGYSHGEVINKNGTELLVHEESREKVSGFLHDVFEGSPALPQMFNNVTKDGSSITCEWFLTPIQNAEGEIIGIDALIQDETAKTQEQQRLRDFNKELERRVTERTKELELEISVRKKSEEAHAKTKGLLLAAIENSPAGILIADAPDVNIRFANVAALRTRGETAKPLINIPYEAHQRNWQVYFPDGRACKANELPLARAVMNGEVTTNAEYMIRRQDGTFRWILVNGAPVKRKNEIVAGVVVFTDITERKEMEKDLKEAMDRAEEASRLKSSIMANMSHEIRTPMNGILGYASVLIDEIQEPDQLTMLNSIVRSGNRLMQMLQSVLDLTQLECNELEVRLEELKVSSSLERILEPYQDMAQAKGLAFSISIEDEILLYTDQRMYQQIISHIVDNAIKFTTKGSVEITVAYKRMNGSAKIAIRDTGIGIDEKHQELIFQEFRQVSEGFSRSHEGSGLGLTLTRGLIEVLGGEIQLESEPGKGSLFTIILPGAKKIDTGEEAAESEPVDEAARREQLKPNVLVVEDNTVNLDITKLFLQKICTVETAKRGANAVELANGKKYDLILMDINLGPDIDGIETARQIRSISGYRNVPIIALTGYAMSGDKQKLLAAGFNDYLSKPFKKSDLTELVQRNLEE